MNDSAIFQGIHQLRIPDEGLDFPQVDRLIIGRGVGLEGGGVRFTSGSLDVSPALCQSADPWCSDNSNGRGGNGVQLRESREAFFVQ